MQVLVRDNNVDQALKALKKKMQREGIFREMKLRGHYEKPSERKAREKAEAIRRARKLARKRLQREGLLPMKPKPTGPAAPVAGRARPAPRGSVEPVSGRPSDRSFCVARAAWPAPLFWQAGLLSFKYRSVCPRDRRPWNQRSLNRRVLGQSSACGVPARHRDARTSDRPAQEEEAHSAKTVPLAAALIGRRWRWPAARPWAIWRSVGCREERRRALWRLAIQSQLAQRGHQNRIRPIRRPTTCAARPMARPAWTSRRSPTSTRRSGSIPTTRRPTPIAALVYRRTNKLDLALADYDKALSLDASYAPAYLGRGIVYSLQGRSEQSLADFNKVDRAAPQ